MRNMQATQSHQMNQTLYRNYSDYNTSAANPNYHNGSSSQGCQCQGRQGVGQGFMSQFSSQAQMLMLMMSIMNQLTQGGFGQLMNGLLGPQGQQGQNPAQMQGQGGPQHAVPTSNPNFGKSRPTVGGPVNGRSVHKAGSAPQVKPGEVKEMKPGQSVRGANGTLFTWGKDGTVKADYQDKNGQKRNIVWKGDTVSFDGGKPQKIDTSKPGEFYKLPNGDVVARGHSVGPNGREHVRLAVGDKVENISAEAGLNKIYEVQNQSFTSTQNEGAGISIDLNAGQMNTAFGAAEFLNTTLSIFMGNPVTRTFSGPAQMMFSGTR